MIGVSPERSVGSAICPVLALLVGLAIGPSLNAQTSPWARSASMAGADFALTRGFAAIEFNRANLYIQDSVAFSFGASLHGGRVLATGASLGELSDIATAAGSGGEAGILDNVPDDGLRIDAVSEGATAALLAEALDIPDPSGNTDIPTFGFTYKNGGLVVRNHTVLSALVSRELIDLAVHGFNPEQINEYAAKNTALSSFTLTTVTFGMGKRFDFDPRFAAGFAVRYVRGRKLLTDKVFEPETDVDNVLLSATAAFAEARGGNGLGLDVGMTYEVRPRLYASFAIQNLGQRMYWSRNLLVSQSEFDQNEIGAIDIREIINRFEPTDFDPDRATLEAYAVSANLYEESFLPRITRVGIGWKGSSGTELQLTGAKTWGEGALIPAGSDRVAAGVQRAWKALRGRGGIAFESGGSRQFAAGLGMDGGSFKIDLGGGWTTGTGHSGARISGLSVSLTLGLVFTELGT